MLHKRKRKLQCGICIHVLECITGVLDTIIAGINFCDKQTWCFTIRLNLIPILQHSPFQYRQMLFYMALSHMVLIKIIV